MSDDGNGAKAKKRRKDPLPDFRAIQYERPVAKKDFIKTNAANAKRNIVMKKEPKRIYIRDNENNEEVIREEHFRRRSSVKPSVSFWLYWVPVYRLIFTVIDKSFHKPVFQRK